MQPDAAIADVWPTLKQKQKFCANCITHLQECQQQKANSWVRLGVSSTGTGQYPGYRICFDKNGSEEIWGSYFHSGKSLPQDYAFVQPGEWSSKRTSLEEFQAFVAAHSDDLT